MGSRRHGLPPSVVRMAVVLMAWACSSQAPPEAPQGESPSLLIERVRRVHQGIAKLKPDYIELAEYGESALIPERMTVFYYHDMVRGVAPPGAKQPRGPMLGEHGCSIHLTVFPPNDDGWPGGRGGPHWDGGRFWLNGGYFVEYSVGTRNDGLRTVVVGAIHEAFASARDDQYLSRRIKPREPKLPRQGCGW